MAVISGACLFMIFPVFSEIPILFFVLRYSGRGWGGVGVYPSVLALWPHNVK